MLAHTTNPLGILMLNLFVDGQGQEMANMQKATGHFLEMKNSAYHCPYDLADNKVNAISVVCTHLYT